MIKPYEHSDVVLQLLSEGMSKIQVLRWLMDCGLTHWQANREVFVFLRRQ